MAKQYGDLVYLNVMGSGILVLHSQKAVAELLVKRSTNTSDRPRLTMANLSGWGLTLALTQYNDRFKAIRRLAAQVLNLRGVAIYMPVLEEKTIELARRMLGDPAQFSEHPRWTAGAIIMAITYGYDVKEENDPWLRGAAQALNNFAQSSAPGWLVDIFPPLQYLPSWFPLASFKRQAAAWRENTMGVTTEPFYFVKQEMSRGVARDSFTRRLLEAETGGSVGPNDEELIKWTSASIFTGAADTTVSATLSFFLAMTRKPEIQKRAQDEIDRVTKGARLPNYADRPNLPYLNALLLEVYRWNPVVPLAIPHVTSEEDVYNGFRIPKGTIIFGNSWHILRDASLYSDPLEFRPERFLGPTPEDDPKSFAFGYGRRECPGRHFADASLFLTLVTTLAVFTITPVVDDQGKELTPPVEYTDGLISHPMPFKCNILPRSPAHASLLA